jgi:hypothetical protein
VAVMQYGIKNRAVLRQALLGIIAFGLAYTVLVYTKIYFVARRSRGRLGNKSAGNMNLEMSCKNGDVIRGKKVERSTDDGVSVNSKFAIGD